MGKDRGIFTHYTKELLIFFFRHRCQMSLLPEQHYARDPKKVCVCVGGWVWVWVWVCVCASCVCVPRVCVCACRHSKSNVHLTERAHMMTVLKITLT